MVTLAIQPSARLSACSTSYRVGATQTARARPAASLRTRSAAPALCRPARRGAAQVVCVADIGDADFEAEVLQSEVPVLVDFWATWCGPCKLMAPMMAWAEKEYEGRLKVVKVEADPNPESIEKYKVYGLPCLILFKGGQEVAGSHNEGAMSKKALQQYLAKHLNLDPVSA